MHSAKTMGIFQNAAMAASIVTENYGISRWRVNGGILGDVSMKIIDIKNVDDSIFQKNNLIKGVSFLDMEDCMFIYTASKGSISVIKSWFDKIGVIYDSIYFVGKMVVYTVQNVELTLSNLSSGERYILYLLACKNVNKKVIAVSLFERLGSRLEHVVYNEFKDYDFLVVITYNFIIDPDFKYLCVKEVSL